MKTKLYEQLKDKCKSFGLTKKGIETLVEIGAADLTDESTDEEISAKADSLVPYAKAMQGEITRKTRKQPSVKKSSDEEDDEEGGNGDDDVPEWFKSQMKSRDEQLQKLQLENETLKAEKAKSQRQTEIADKAKKLGIPDYLMKRVSFADDADLDKELADYKQELVTNNLMPKGQAHEISKLDEAQAKADAKAWAAGLPD